MSASLGVGPVGSKQDFTDFIRLPSALYRGAKSFVAPLEMERRENLDPAKNPFFEHAQATYWLARRGGRVVGRVSAQIDRLAQESWGRKIAFFGFLDAEDDARTFAALLDEAERWAKARGASAIVGPFSHSINEESGLLVDGFSARPAMMMPYHPPYAGGHVEAAGYAPARDLLAYDYRLGTRRLRPSTRANGTRERFTIRRLDMRRYDREVVTLVDIFNDAWSKNWGFTPFTPAEVAHMAKALRPLICADLVYFAEVEGKPAAMVVCLPDLAEATRDLDGKLLPFGWAKLLWRLKVAGVKSARLPLMGVRKRYQKSLMGPLLVRGMLERLDQALGARGMSHAELSWILEDNRPMRRLLEGAGATPYKTYRIYEKALT